MLDAGTVRLVAGLLLVLVIAGLAAYRGRLEDEFLRSPQAFGERYAAYAGQTGRFLPRFRRSGL